MSGFDDSQDPSQGLDFGDYDQQKEESVVDVLRRSWLNEKGAPELLAYEAILVPQIKELLEAKQEVIEDLRDVQKNHFDADLYQMEVDRVGYYLNAYLRIRLKKIERHVIYLLMNNEMNSLLAPCEMEFAQKYLDLLEKHYNTSFLEHVPDKFQDLTLKNDDVNMVEQPNVDAHVFLRVKHDIGPFDLTEDGETEVDLKQGDIYAASYLPFRELLLEDKIELI